MEPHVSSAAGRELSGRPESRTLPRAAPFRLLRWRKHVLWPQVWGWITGVLFNYEKNVQAATLCQAQGGNEMTESISCGWVSWATVAGACGLLGRAAVMWLSVLTSLGPWELPGGRKDTYGDSCIARWEQHLRCRLRRGWPNGKSGDGLEKGS